MSEQLLGKYRHFRNMQLYEVIGFGLHSETREDVVIYKALYESPEFGLNQVWVRPRSMFFEDVEHEGKLVPRFEKVIEA